MAAKKKATAKARPARRMDRTGAGRNLLASMVACRAAIGMYVDKNRAGKGGEHVCGQAGVGRAALTNLEISKSVVAKEDVRALMDAMKVPEGKSLALLYTRLSNLIRSFGGNFE
jgi:hypothetical protein